MMNGFNNIPFCFSNKGLAVSQNLRFTILNSSYWHVDVHLLVYLLNVALTFKMSSERKGRGKPVQIAA